MDQASLNKLVLHASNDDVVSFKKEFSGLMKNQLSEKYPEIEKKVLDKASK